MGTKINLTLRGKPILEQRISKRFGHSKIPAGPSVKTFLKEVDRAGINKIVESGIKQFLNGDKEALMHFNLLLQKRQDPFLEAIWASRSIKALLIPEYKIEILKEIFSSISKNPEDQKLIFERILQRAKEEGGEAHSAILDFIRGNIPVYKDVSLYSRLLMETIQKLLPGAKKEGIAAFEVGAGLNPQFISYLFRRVGVRLYFLIGPEFPFPAKALLEKLYLSDKTVFEHIINNDLISRITEYFERLPMARFYEMPNKLLITNTLYPFLSIKNLKLFLNSSKGAAAVFWGIPITTLVYDDEVKIGTVKDVLNHFKSKLGYVCGNRFLPINFKEILSLLNKEKDHQLFYKLRDYLNTNYLISLFESEDLKTELLEEQGIKKNELSELQNFEKRLNDKEKYLIQNGVVIALTHPKR